MNKSRYALSATAAALLTAMPVQLVSAAAFSENFNDGLASSRWSVTSQQEGVVGPDGTVNLAFNYGSLGISSPAGSSDTLGAFIQVNNTDAGAVNEGESYSIFPNSYMLPSGYWRVDADMFVWNDGGAGTTEFGMIGAYMNPAAPVSPYEWGANGGPLGWIYSGEGGAARDLAVFKEGGVGNKGYNSLGDYNTIPAGTIPGFQTGVSGSLGPAGSNPSGSWVDVAVEKVGNTISWYLNGALVNSYDNSGGFYTTGTIFLGAADPFNSTNAAGGTVIDNVVVTVPEPTSLALLGIGSLLFRRRRA